MSDAILSAANYPLRVLALLTLMHSVHAVASAHDVAANRKLPAADQPPTSLAWDMAAAVAEEKLSFSEQVLAFAAQGLVNRHPTEGIDGNTTVYFDIGKMNYDWPEADAYWRKLLEADKRVSFTPLPSTLCGLVEAAVKAGAIAGSVQYDESAHPERFGDGYSMAIALTLTGQLGLLPVERSALARHSCLKQLHVKSDVSKLLHGKTRLEAWDWAVENLLPKSSKQTVFNLNRYRVTGDPLEFRTDKQSPATASSIDYIVQQNAFVLDLETHDASQTGCNGKPCNDTAPWNQDDELVEKVFAQLAPLFDAYGWSDDEFSWTNMTSHFGGTIMCSFASPNFSFWSRLALPEGRTVARKLPTNDRGIALDRSKYYVTFETNEGDTPRVLASAMCSSWPNPKRGSFPVAWAIDPLLAERFPALFDYYASTAHANDSFISGTAGAGYAYLNQMSSVQLQRYGQRVGRLTEKYGPHVVDTYGYANVSVHEDYRKAMARGGSAPAAFVTQANWVNAFLGDAYAPFHCPNDNLRLSDGTPLICSSGSPKLFYYSSSLNASCPSCDLAERIQAVAKRQPPPFFVLVYGGLQAFGGVDTESPKSFFTLLGDTIERLGSEFVTIGSSEMARLAREAGVDNV